jgi:HD-GYP domain-containing protein (c-di-GMP phosphodiesterase class II)
LRGWAQALEYRDGETAGHSYRVAELSVRLARELGFSEDDLHGIEHGTYLHDIFY